MLFKLSNLMYIYAELVFAIYNIMFKKLNKDAVKCILLQKKSPAIKFAELKLIYGLLYGRSSEQLGH